MKKVFAIGAGSAALLGLGYQFFRKMSQTRKRKPASATDVIKGFHELFPTLVQKFMDYAKKEFNLTQPHLDRLRWVSEDLFRAYCHWLVYISYSDLHELLTHVKLSRCLSTTVSVANATGQLWQSHLCGPSANISTFGVHCFILCILRGLLIWCFFTGRIYLDPTWIYLIVVLKSTNIEVLTSMSSRSRLWSSDGASRYCRPVSLFPTTSWMHLPQGYHVLANFIWIFILSSTPEIFEICSL